LFDKWKMDKGESEMRTIDKPSWKMKQKLFSELNAYLEVWRAENLLDDNKKEKYPEVEMKFTSDDVANFVQGIITEKE